MRLNDLKIGRKYLIRAILKPKNDWEIEMLTLNFTHKRLERILCRLHQLSDLEFKKVIVEFKNSFKKL